ncbi:hypothetical protein [Streptobacillus canis]|uniref:hypothetical protein n=1 Tax=Streptobacillus canis TaxID=2678686 RepID=UPI0012E2E479|nr:hypothetical protein [Streptobacillus canis]
MNKKNWNDTDYDIFKFSYKSGMLIIFGSTLVALFALFLSNIFNINQEWSIKILTSVFIGFSYAYSQYFIERKIGLVKGFFVMAISIIIILLLILSFVRF